MKHTLFIYIVLFFLYYTSTIVVHASSFRLINTDALNVRKGPGIHYKRVGQLYRGDKVEILDEKGNWSKIGLNRWVKSEYLKTPSIKKTKVDNNVAEFAMKFLGGKYKYGGTSPKGFDCSGFTQYIYKHFGYNIPRTSYSQRTAGKRVKNLTSAQQGDLICYSGHVAIYLGNGKIIHASNSAPYPKGGVKISAVTYRPIVIIRRILK